MIQMQTEAIRRTMFEHNGDSLEVKVTTMPDDRGCMRDEVVITHRVNGGVACSTRIPITERTDRDILENFFTRCAEQLRD